MSSALQTIGETAFWQCASLEEVVIPPYVESIGEGAFSNNPKLKSIIMGHEVTEIGEHAFDGCPLKSVSITAQTPPTASNNTFSDYSGTLYLNYQSAIDAYHNATACWNQFESMAMIAPSSFTSESEIQIEGKKGEQFQLSVTLTPSNVTLPHVFWQSTNTNIATVDENGIVTLMVDLDDIATLAFDDSRANNECMIIASSLYGNVNDIVFPIDRVITAIDNVFTDKPADSEIDYTLLYEVYNLNGLLMGKSTDNLAPGIYILRQGTAVNKIVKI